MLATDSPAVTMKHRIVQAIIVALLTAGCGTAAGDGWLEVPPDQYVLISKRSEGSGAADYAAVKLTRQGNTIEEPLVYEWIALPPGEFVVSVEAQNFKAGTKNTIGRFGIGFEGYRFAWEPVSGAGEGRIRSSWHGVRGVRYCLSLMPEVWGKNLRQAIDELERAGQCEGRD